MLAIFLSPIEKLPWLDGKHYARPVLLRLSHYTPNVDHLPPASHRLGNQSPLNRQETPAIRDSPAFAVYSP